MNHSPLLSRHTFLHFQKCCSQMNFFAATHQQLSLLLTCHLLSQTSLLLMPLCTFQQAFLLLLLHLLLAGPLFHFSPLCSLSSQLHHSLTFTPNRVLIFFYILFSSLIAAPSIFLTCNVLGLMPHNPGLGKSEMSE